MKPVFSIGTYIYIVISLILVNTGFAQVSPVNRGIRSPNSNFKHGSFCVAFVRGDTITVGIESRIMGPHVVPDTACKIFESNGVIFASVGIFAHYRFNIRDEAKRDLILPITLEKRVQRFDSVTFNWMRTWVDSLSYHDLFSNSEMARNALSIRALFATFINGSPILYNRTFHPRMSGHHVIVDTSFTQSIVTPDEWVCSPFEGDSTYLTGYIEALNKTNMIITATPETIIRALIENQSKMDSIWIGGPIDIVQLTRDGKARWIQRKENCH